MQCSSYRNYCTSFNRTVNSRLQHTAQCTQSALHHKHVHRLTAVHLVHCTADKQTHCNALYDQCTQSALHLVYCTWRTAPLTQRGDHDLTSPSRTRPVHAATLAKLGGGFWDISTLNYFGLLWTTLEYFGLLWTSLGLVSSWTTQPYIKISQN